MNIRKSLIMLIAILASCTSPTPELNRQIGSAKKVLVTSDIKDRVFGTRLDGLFMKATPAFPTQWRSNDALSEEVKNQLARTGHIVDSIALDDLAIDQAIGSVSVNEAMRSISVAMSRSTASDPADLHLVAIQVPIDAVPRPVSGSELRMISGGLVGLLWETSTKYQQSYAVRVNNSVNAIAWGKAQCIVVYSLAAIDPETHTIMFKFHPRWAESSLPDDFWIGDFRSLPAPQREVLRKSCLSALRNGVAEDLRKLGLR